MTLLKGTLDVLVLKALSWGPMHGFEITRWLEDRSQGNLSVDGGALFQALHRMEERDLIARFGAAYRSYISRVPAFFPSPLKKLD